MRARDNPFATSRVAALRFRMGDGDRAALLARWRDLGGRGALVGPHGAGKTRLLGELGRWLEADGFRTRALRFGTDYSPSTDERRAAVHDLGPRDVLLVDGAEQLSAFTWWRLRRAAAGAAGVVITVHRPQRLPTLARVAASPELLQALVLELVGLERASALAPLCRELFVRHGGNVRECLRSLYDADAATLEAAEDHG